MNLKIYDQIIIGGGFAGAAIAYHLARRGSKVLLLEAKNLLGGSSGACAGRVQLIESESEDYLRLVWNGYKHVKLLSEELDYDMEWDEPGHLTLLRTEKEWKEYEGHVRVLNNNGIPAQMIDKDELAIEEPMLSMGKLIGAAYSCEGHVNPFKYCFGFLCGVVRFGGELKTYCPLTGFEMNGPKLDAVITPHGRYSAGSYIIATGAWAAQTLGMVDLMFPIKFTHAEAMVSEELPKMINHHIGLPGFYETVHVQDSHALLELSRNVTLGVGQHMNGSFVISNAIEQTNEINTKSSSWGMPAVSRALLEYLPKLNKIKIIRTWAAPSPFMPDYLPAVGKVPGFENVYTSVAFHLAIPTIPLLSNDLSKLILDNEISQHLKCFDPARFF